MIKTPEQLNQLARGFQQSRILLTAFELDLFTPLDQDELSSKELSEKLETDERATDRLLNALCALNLIQKNDGKYSNSKIASTFLVKGKEPYMGGLAHANNMWDSWSSLTSAIIRNEKKAEKLKQQKESTWYDSFITAMHSRARLSAPQIISQLDLKDVNSVLDVGGGSGAFSIQFVKSGENIRSTLFDLPQVTEMAKRYVTEAGVEGLIDFTAGDYTKDASLGSGFDLAFLSAIIHSNSPATNESLVRKCYDALNPNGRIVIQDFIMDDDRTGPIMGALFALNMLVATRDGDTYTENEIRGWLEKAGFSRIQRLEPTGPSASIVAYKE